MGIAKILGDNIRQLRQRRGLSQAALAELADLSLMTVNGYENESLWPRPGAIEALAKALKVKPSRLFQDPSLFDSELALRTVIDAMGFEPVALRKKSRK